MTAWVWTKLTCATLEGARQIFRWSSLRIGSRNEKKGDRPSANPATYLPRNSEAMMEAENRSILDFLQPFRSTTGQRNSLRPTMLARNSIRTLPFQPAHKLVRQVYAHCARIFPETSYFGRPE
jgi:hypothetical protein